MKYDPEKHHRRSIRLKGYDYTDAGTYYVTIVTRDREQLFGAILGGAMQLNAAGQIADDCWRAIPEHFPDVVLDAFVIMPNHVHGVIILNDAGRGTINHASAPPPRPDRPILGRAIHRRAWSLGSCDSKIMTFGKNLA